MSELTDAVSSLRAAFARPAGIVAVEVQGDPRAPDAVVLHFDVAVDLDELAEAFGPPSPVPPMPNGQRWVQFTDTFPATGPGCTVLAELDGDGAVLAVVLRPERD